MTTSTLDLTPASPRKQRIAAVRDMARQLRSFFDRRLRFEEFEDIIKKWERRRGAQSVAVAADYNIVRCFARAFEVFEKNEGSVPASALIVHTEDLLALAMVAEWSLHNPYRGIGSSKFDRRPIEQFIDIGELKHAATLLKQNPPG